MPFQFEPTAIPEVVRIIPRVFADDRGFFVETYKVTEFAENGIVQPFVQTNHSRSTRGVLRGLHYQVEPNAQGKLIHCGSGRIFDVAVDLRKSSSTFSKWVGVELSDDNLEMLYIPPGFAHGFYTLSEVADIMYQVTAEYAPESERGLIYNDPDVGIQWPEGPIFLSDKDTVCPSLDEAELFE